MILGLTFAALAVALAVTFVSAFVRGLAGFGMAILLVPVLGLIIAPAEAVAVAMILGLLVGLADIRAMARASEPSARIIAIVAVAATPLGMAALVATSLPLARVIIAAIAAGAFALIFLPLRSAKPAGPIETGMTGLAAGLLTGFAGMPGPPLVPYYLGRAIDPAAARASMMVVFLATAAAGSLSALVLGTATAHSFALALLLLPIVLLGNWLGSRAFGSISERTWRLATGAVLGAAALGAVLKLL